MIYHVATKGEWEGSTGDFYSPSAFQREGFIHCCTQEQLQGVLHRYFAGRADLYVLALREDLLDAELKYEPSTNDELYPHLYGKINKNAIVSCQTLTGN